jgi:dethiobiotin synthetase
MTTIFITGTDTGVGKTWVGCALGRALTAMDRRVVAVKPVETGCDGRAIEDGALLAQATGQREPRQALRRLRAPISAAQAAEREKVTLDFDELLLETERAGADADVLLVEGTGGLLSPLAWDWNAADLAAALSAHVLLVGVDRLGAINHALLTIGAAELTGLNVLGIVLTSPREPDSSTGENAGAIARLSGIVRTHVAPWTDDADLAARSMRDVADWIFTGAVPTGPGPVGGA